MECHPIVWYFQKYGTRLVRLILSSKVKNSVKGQSFAIKYIPPVLQFLTSDAQIHDKPETNLKVKRESSIQR